jgi:hypothetical protein
MEEIAVLKTAERDNEWLQSNFEKIQEEHPNEFVVVSQGRVIAGGKDFEEVVKEVEAKGVDPAATLIEFIPEKGLIFIL